MNRFFALTSLLPLSIACGDAPQEQVELDLLARGTAARDFSVNGVQLNLGSARLAFGPLYLCPGAQAGELCDSARMEWLESEVVDVLDPKEQILGKLTGVTGAVRSWMFDFGFASVLTSEEPLVLSAAEQLGNASLILDGVATLDGTEVPFSLEAVVRQGEGTEQGVSVVRKSTTDDFFHEITRKSESLHIEFDVRNWVDVLSRVDFEAELLDGCEIGTAESCPEVFFARDSRLASVVAQRMEAGVRPKFELR